MDGAEGRRQEAEAEQAQRVLGQIQREVGQPQRHREEIERQAEVVRQQDQTALEEDPDLIKVLEKRSREDAEEFFAQNYATAVASSLPVEQPKEDSGAEIRSRSNALSTGVGRISKNASALVEQDCDETGDLELMKYIAKHSRDPSSYELTARVATSEPLHARRSAPAGHDITIDSTDELMKIIAERSREPALLLDHEEEETEELIENSISDLRIHSQRAKKRVPGPIQPGAFGAAPGERPSRMQSLRFSTISDPSNHAALPTVSFHGDEPGNSDRSALHDSNQMPAPPSTRADVDNDTPANETKEEPQDGPQELAQEATETTTRPSPPQSSNDGLAVANLVQDDTDSSLMEAKEVDPEDLQRKEHKEQKRRTFRLAGCAIIATCCIGLALVLGFTLGKKDNIPATVAPTLVPSGAPSLVPSGDPSSAPSGALDILLQDLPAYTLQALKNISTPQWKAQVWLSNHPELPGMEDWRKKQLFALVSFFFAMEGPNWPKPIRARWLQYDVDECYWFSNEFGKFNEEGTYEEIGYFNTEPCDATGDFQHLSLVGLNLSDYQPFVPPELALLTSLQVLQIMESGVNASLAEFLPSDIHTIPNLFTFAFADNSLWGSIPSELALLTSMRFLYMGSNHLSGAIPSELTFLTDIHVLYLAQNQITGLLPSELALLSDLTYLDLGGNHLTGPIPSELALLSDLTHLDLWGNHLTGPIPTELGLVAHNPWFTWTLKRKLEFLSFASNVLTGAIPTELGLMTHLLDLQLWGNSLSGAIPTEFGMLSSLEEMQLAANRLSGKIPSELALISDMKTLLLALNHLTGIIPTELGMLSNMTGFYLYRNSLTGTIPTEMGLMTSIKDIRLNDNSLRGVIPSELGLASNLGYLALSSNYLSGAIPSELGLMTRMSAFSLRNNALTGIIPTEFGLLVHLEALRAENNTLSGTIPVQFDSLVSNGSLYWLVLENNDLSGEASEELCSLGQFNRSAFALGLASPFGVSFDCNDKFCGCQWCPCYPSSIPSNPPSMPPTQSPSQQPSLSPSNPPSMPPSQSSSQLPSLSNNPPSMPPSSTLNAQFSSVWASVIKQSPGPTPGPTLGAGSSNNNSRTESGGLLMSMNVSGRSEEVEDESLEP